MDDAPSCPTRAFDGHTKRAFLDYLHASPNNRRVSLAERKVLIEWLTETAGRPSSQKEFSRRNYVKRRFMWNEETQILQAVGKNTGDQRLVITEESIADVVEIVHIQSGHLGWDATWRDVNAKYYGILRSDVIFLLKSCTTCAHNPLKRSKKRNNSVDTRREQEA